MCQCLLDRKSAAKEINSTSGTLAVWVTSKVYGLIHIKIGRTVRYRPFDLQSFNLERLRTRKLC
ncbi:DNA-binding protein [Emticicia sp. C21]|nr:DNA-binding protein [Emticicia sp. C21]